MGGFELPPSASTGLRPPMGGPTLAQIRASEVLSDYRMTPATLMAKLDPSYIASKWVLYLSYKIAQAVSKGSCGLLISAPPRHGKSMLSTVATPLWVLENFPHFFTGVITYGEDLSTDFSRQIRDHIQQNPDLLNVRLRADSTRVANFLTTAGGGLRSVGLRGTITGRGFNVLVIDDYIKEPKEAESATYLEGLWTWYRTVARTRLEPGAVIIILATRWVRNDLHGKLEKLQQLTGRNFWTSIELPALALSAEEQIKKPDLIGRLPGQALFPERYTSNDILDIKVELGSRWFEAMFQQNPMGTEGSVIDTGLIQRWSEEKMRSLRQEILANPTDYIIGRYWDLASTANAGDFTTGARCIWAKKTNMFITDDLFRGQLSSGKVEAQFEETTRKDLALYPRCKQIGIEEEPGSSGAYTTNHFSGIAKKVNASLSILPHKAATKGSKLLNAQPYIAHEETGLTAIVEAEWNEDFLAELGDFPEGLHDDQVDAVAGGYKLVRGLIGKSATWGRSAQEKSLLEQMRTQPGKSLPNSTGSSVTWGRKAYDAVGGR